MDDDDAIVVDARQPGRVAGQGSGRAGWAAVTLGSPDSCDTARGVRIETVTTGSGGESARVLAAVEDDEAANPMDVGLDGARAGVTDAEGGARGGVPGSGADVGER